MRANEAHVGGTYTLTSALHFPRTRRNSYYPRGHVEAPDDGPFTLQKGATVTCLKVAVPAHGSHYSLMQTTNGKKVHFYHHTKLKASIRLPGGDTSIRRKAEYTALEGQVKNWQKEITTHKKTIKSSESAISNLNTKIEAAEQRVNNLKAYSTDEEALLDVLNKKQGDTLTAQELKQMLIERGIVL